MVILIPIIGGIAFLLVAGNSIRKKQRIGILSLAQIVFGISFLGTGIMNIFEPSKSTIAPSAEVQKGSFAVEHTLGKRYIDPKGFFKVNPPDGWRLQEFPQDSRGKVAFFGPESNIDLRVLVNAVDFTSFEQLFEWCKESETILKQRLQATDFVVEKITFGGLPAVKRTFQAQGLRFQYIDFLVGKSDHNLAYGAPPNKFDKYYKAVTQSMESYEPIFRDLSRKT